MNKEINFEDYEFFLQWDEAYAKAAELLGLTSDVSKDAIHDYIREHYEWYRNDKEYQYMGYDCGDCYMGGDVKRGIICGEYLVVSAVSPPNYKNLVIYKKKV